MPAAEGVDGVGMGLMQRQKGKRFERAIATLLRAHFPDAVVRRASQADRAHQSDVYVQSKALLLERLWLECQDARDPNPWAKLMQAERDCAGVMAPRERYLGRLPVVVWHKLGARSIHVSLRLHTLDEIRGVDPRGPCSGLVTMQFGELLGIVAEKTFEMERAA